VSNPNGTLTITKASITVVNNSRSKVYGVTLTNADYTGSISGVIAGDVITVTRSSAGDAASATVVAPGPTYPITGTLVDPGSRLANYYLSNPNGTLTITTATTTSSITVSPTTQQYSDLVTLTATITGGAPLVTGGPQAAASATFMIGTQTMSTANFVVSGANLVATLSNVALLEPTPFGTSPTGQMAPGNRTVMAVINSPDLNFSIGDLQPTTTPPLVIKQEDAKAEYAGDMIVATASTTTSTAIVTLRANISDINVINPAVDPNWGDIRNAKVKFIVTNMANTVIYNSGWRPITTLVNSADVRTGTDTAKFIANIGSATDEEYSVRVLVGYDAGNYCGYYIAQEENAVVTVYKPVGDFITGGGYITPTNSVGTYASDAGKKTNFGFNVKYSSNGSNLKGNMNVIFRRTEAGVVKTYQIKANAMQSLAVDARNPKRQTATFITKSNLTDITNPMSPVAKGGNLYLYVNMIDNGEPGSKDSISFVLVPSSSDPNILANIMYSSNWVSTKTNQMILSGGNPACAQWI
jgi:hypothetical protein